MKIVQSFVGVSGAWLVIALVGGCTGGRSTLSPSANAGTESSSSTSSGDAGSKLPACGTKETPCDPKNLGGATCSSMGAGQGTLQCDPVTCSFDFSMCSLSPMSGNGTGGLGAFFGRTRGGSGGSTGSSGRGATTGGRAAPSRGGAGGRGGHGGAGGVGGKKSEANGGGGEGGSSGAGGESGGAGGESGGVGAAGEAAGAGGETGGSGGDLSMQSTGGSQSEESSTESEGASGSGEQTM